jgi:hypothetical protein
MRILSLVIFCILLIFFDRQPDSPHGPDFKITCSNCHSPKGWQIDKETYAFDHNTTRLPLVGQHTEIGCRQCHPTLVFSSAKTECNECHTDVHQATVGQECAHCHTPSSWLVSNINEIHQMSRFPLLGAHRTADCNQCHQSESLVRFDVLGVECIDCHREDYMATTAPNHIESGMSEDCVQCHLVNSFQWTGAGFDHSSFPLTLGHASPACIDCHTGGNYSSTSTDCYDCHQTDYNETVNPDHQALSFSVTCTECHTTNPGWKPASYLQHDSQSFPIYSGKHQGEWNSCTECHENTSNYAQFTCLSCHEHNKTDMDNEHNDENGYSYVSSECLRCHPRGDAE